MSSRQLSLRARPRVANLGRLTQIFLFGALIVSPPSEGAACGYHDDVSLARGVLNWVYPDSLHVVGAISTAVAERRLPVTVSARGVLGLLGYHKTVRALDQHAQQLHQAAGETPPLKLSLLLIEPMLWTHFVSDGGDVRTQVHMSGPRAEDLVVITGEEVIRAIVDHRLTVGDAYRSGLMRLYGMDEQVASFLALYDQVGRLRPAH
jgi:hypothetical protein